jgi:glutamine amidotransferase
MTAANPARRPLAAARDGDASPKVAIVATGAANLASVLAALRRAGCEPFVTRDPDELAGCGLALLPGVGAFGPAIDALRATGLEMALESRFREGKPLMAICLGMQLCFEESEESPGVRGLGFLPGRIRRFGAGLPVPQLGWNRIRAEARAAPAGADGTFGAGEIARPRFLEPGWAYFANSYKLDGAPAGAAALYSDYGGSFVAALELGSLLLCQFHPELSGELGRRLLARWTGAAAGAAVAGGKETR